MKMYIVKALLISGSIVVSSFALTDVSEEAKKSSSEAIKATSKVEQSVKNAEKHHKNGNKEATEKELKKTEVSLDSAKEKVQKTSDATEKIQKKAEEIAHVTAATKEKTSDVHAKLNETKKAISSTQKIVDDATKTARDIQRAHNEGNVDKAKKHTNEIIEYLEKLGKEIQHMFDTISDADRKTQEVDDAVKTQMLLVDPKGKYKHKKGWFSSWFTQEPKKERPHTILDKESFAEASAEGGEY